MAVAIEISVPDRLIGALGANREAHPRQMIEALMVQCFRRVILLMQRQFLVEWASADISLGSM